MPAVTYIPLPVTEAKSNIQRKAHTLFTTLETVLLIVRKTGFGGL